MLIYEGVKLETQGKFVRTHVFLSFFFVFTSPK